MSITHVSETAHWVAMYRAFESERADALFNDPHARQMAGELGDAIVRDMPPAHGAAWAIIVRTAAMDDMILDRIRAGATRVLNLGAGLDTRAFRLPLPATLRWFDVDLPPMVEHRKACLKDATPRCIHVHIAADLNDDADVSRVLSMTGPDQGPLLVVSEGLLVYLEPAQVGALAASLCADRAARWWITDLVNPLALGMLGDGCPAGTAASAPFRFAPVDSVGFFAPLGWREVSYRCTVDEAVRLRRLPPVVQWWRTFVAPWWPASHRISGCSLMEAAA